MTPDQWQHHITAWQRSNQSKHAYCQAQGIVYSRFLYWSNRRVNSALPTPPADSDTDLLPVTVTEDEAPADCLGIVEFPNGTKLHIHSPQLLSNLHKLLPL